MYTCMCIFMYMYQLSRACRPQQHFLAISGVLCFTFFFRCSNIYSEGFLELCMCMCMCMAQRLSCITTHFVAISKAASEIHVYMSTQLAT